MGDMTAKQMGRLTLNPLAHIDVYGLLALVFVHFGWGKPVPFNPNNLRYKKWGGFLVGVAGPCSNLFLLTLSGLLIKSLQPNLGNTNLLIVFLGFSFMINAALMLFNLLPFPPLDGSKLVIALLHGPKWARARFAVEQYGQYALLAILLLDIVLGLGLLGMFLDPTISRLISYFGVGDALTGVFSNI